MIKPAPDAARALTVEEYLRQERDARDRGSKVGYEYVAGEMFLMSPISPRHSVITLNIALRLRDAARIKGCELYGDVITQIADDRFYYPDVTVTCKPLDNEIIIAPCFVVEVTSPSTRTTDLREKPTAYRSCPSIQGFLIAEQRRRQVIQYTRVGDEWTREEFREHGTLTIASLDARLTLDHIYETLDFPKRIKEGDEFSTEDYGKEYILVRAEAVS
jgi:Uma2 family endonuclease